MTLVYRAIWQVDNDDPVSLARYHFSEWVANKYRGAVVPHEGAVDIGNGVEIRATFADDENGMIGQIALFEERGSERWTTKLTATAGVAPVEQSFWVDLSRVSQDPYARYDVVAPRLIAQLLSGSTNPRRGPVVLSTRPRAYRVAEVEELINLLCDPTRDIPITVLTKSPALDDSEWVERAAIAAKGVAGTTAIVMLPPDAERQFNQKVGDDSGVWAGALRVYLPGFNPKDGKSWRHRYVQAYKLDQHRNATRQRIVQLIGHYMTGMRAPHEYSELRPLLRKATAVNSREWEELLEDTLEDVDTLKGQISALEDSNVDLEAELELAQIANNRLRSSLAIALAPDEAARDSVAAIPPNAKSCSQAISQAQLHLDRVVIPEGACVDIDDLDTALASRSWGETTWQGLRALQAYAEDEFDGGFWQWCEKSGNPAAWPATSKKLAMSESSSTRNRKRFREARVFAIDRQVEQSGSIYMEAHLKIAEGGGDNAPRLYFHDDTGGTTKKVHIGFIGPHKHVPNDSA